MKKINFGIIGAGVIAEEYLKILSKNKKINISGIVGRTKKNSKRLSLKYNTNLFSTIDDLIRENLDIIIVAVNILSTVFVAKKLSKFKGKILFEKPLGVNLKQTLKISNHLSKNKKNCFVALNRRFYENIRFAKELLVNDKSKKIIQVIDQENLYLAKKLGHPKLVLNN